MLGNAGVRHRSLAVINHRIPLKITLLVKPLKDQSAVLQAAQLKSKIRVQGAAVKDMIEIAFGVDGERIFQSRFDGGMVQDFFNDASITFDRNALGLAIIIVVVVVEAQRKPL